jgi:pimeloyl-ACP methyl ester carboxylesterase
VKRRRRLLTFLVILALCYAGLCVLGRLGYRALLYPAPRQDLTPDPPSAEKLSVVAADGTRVHALLIASGPVTIVFFHGNGEVIGDDLWLAEQMSARGFSTVLVEYRGYGRSAGSPSEAGLYADAEAVFAELARRGTGPQNVVLWGQSLGTGVAAEMARRGHGAKLVLISPYTSIPDVGAAVMPWLPVRLLVADRFSSSMAPPTRSSPSPWARSCLACSPPVRSYRCPAGVTRISSSAAAQGCSIASRPSPTTPPDDRSARAPPAVDRAGR